MDSNNSRIERVENALERLVTLVSKTATQRGQQSRAIQILLRMTQAQQESWEEMSRYRQRCEREFEECRRELVAQRQELAQFRQQQQRREREFEEYRQELARYHQELVLYRQELAELRQQQSRLQRKQLETDRRFNILLEEVRYLIRRLRISDEGEYN